MHYLMLREASWIWWLWNGYGSTTPVVQNYYTDPANVEYTDPSGDPYVDADP